MAVRAQAQGAARSGEAATEFPSPGDCDLAASVENAGDEQPSAAVCRSLRESLPAALLALAEHRHAGQRPHGAFCAWWGRLGQEEEPGNMCAWKIRRAARRFPGTAVRKENTASSWIARLRKAGLRNEGLLVEGESREDLGTGAGNRN